MEVCKGYCDGNGKVFQEFDVVKVYHFTGRYRKKHYMYKWIRRNSGGVIGFQHLGDVTDCILSLAIACKGFGWKEDDSFMVWEGSEIVQSNY